ncbi:hypothetical protein [Vibrio gallaecicus]|uniref:hypothetical protein n=1 Tax=Vibrio gallaecicus TaxID=552386 RepID=UPI0025B420C6|nr:hypothetical protein [Vibrio gallaecicus]MDN3613826.1 hypothetical protein [Vibrio gallaecicus]
MRKLSHAIFLILILAITRHSSSNQSRQQTNPFDDLKAAFSMSFLFDMIIIIITNPVIIRSLLPLYF